MPENLTRISAAGSRIVRWCAGAGLLLITAIIAWQVFARYVLNASPAWAEQAALLLMIWYVLLAAAAGVREGFHIRIAVFADALPPRARRAIVILMHALVGAFGLAMAWFGAELARETWQHVIPTLGISRGFAYVPISIAGVLIAAWSVEHVVAVIRGTEIEGQWS